MVIVNWVSGILSLAMVIVFLGKYAVSVNSAPLWVIIVLAGVLAPIVDFVKTMREGVDGDDLAAPP